MRKRINEPLHKEGIGLKQYTVEDSNGQLHTIIGHYKFNNNGALVFRRHYGDDYTNKTYVIAEFAAGFWNMMKEKPYNG